MNISEKVKEIESFVVIQGHDKSKHTLTTMLNLPIVDPEYAMHDIYYKFKALSERNAFSIINLMDKIKTRHFDKETNFDPNSKDAYVEEINPERVSSYINSIYNQWINIAERNDVKLNPSIYKEKEAIIKEFNEFAQHFEDYRLFINKYKILEPLYIQNKHNADEEPFFRSEMDKLADEYSNLLTHETARIFFSNQTLYGGDMKDCFIPQLFTRLSASIEEVKSEIKQQCPQAIATMATKFVMSQSESASDIANFLATKNIEENIKIQVQLTASQQISGVIVFTDGSMAVRNRNDLYRDVGIEQSEQVMHDLIKSTIDYKFRKKPMLGKILKEKFDEDCSFFNEVDVVMNTYLDNEAILKNMKFDFNIISDKSFEEFDDAMNSSLNDYKIYRYANSILSNKYKDLLTDKALESFKILYESEITASTLQNLIGKKLAAIQSSSEFEKYLDKVVNQFNGFTPEALTTKLESLNITPLLTDNDVYVFEVKSFEESKALGSVSWCIARNQHYFDNYTSNEKRQFFIYDFNQNDKSNESMIGITLEKSGKFNTQHLKNDDYFSPNDLLKDIQKRLILKEIEAYKLDDSMKKQLGIEEKPAEVDAFYKKNIKASI